MQDIYLKNLEALREQNPDLVKELEAIKELKKYEVFQEGESATELNIYDHENKEFIYTNSKIALSSQLTEIQVYKNYKYLYIFGLENGFFTLSILLSLKRLNRLIVFEPELEILYINLHLHDFSAALSTGKLLLFHAKKVTLEVVEKLLIYSDTLMYSKVFEMLSNNYNRNYHVNELQKIQKWFNAQSKHFISMMGNDITDSLKGMNQTFNNLSRIINSPKLRDLKLKKNSDTAIIVSTGPSLKKQLPLLKEVSPYATLISVDASLPILEAAGIRPDLCVSLERDEPTAKFFSNTHPSFHKGIIFLCASVQHESVFNAIQSETLLTVFRPQASNMFFELDDYGYLGRGFSAANMGHDLAFEMGFKTCILIGQDLAFGADGATHSQGHIIESNALIEKEKEEGRLFEVEAYGKKGTVTTHFFWDLFKNSFVTALREYNESMTTINATQGGVHIPLTQEDTFPNLVKVLKGCKQKEAITLALKTTADKAQVTKEIKHKLRKLLKEGKKVEATLNPIAILLQRHQDKTHGYTQEEQKIKVSLNEVFSLIEQTDKNRNTLLLNKTFTEFYLSIIQPAMIQDELALCAIKSTYNNDEHLYLLNVLQANISSFIKLQTFVIQIKETIQKTLNEL